MNENNKSKNPKLPTSIMLFLRIFIGGYLCYLAYQIMTGGDTTANPIVVYVFSVIFVIAGIGLIILSLKMIIRGEYQGGFGDIEAKNEEIIDETKTEENVDNNTI